VISSLSSVSPESRHAYGLQPKVFASLLYERLLNPRHKLYLQSGWWASVCPSVRPYVDWSQTLQAKLESSSANFTKWRCLLYGSPSPTPPPFRSGWQVQRCVRIAWKLKEASRTGRLPGLCRLATSYIDTLEAGLFATHASCEWHGRQQPHWSRSASRRWHAQNGARDA